MLRIYLYKELRTMRTKLNILAILLLVILLVPSQVQADGGPTPTLSIAVGTFPVDDSGSVLYHEGESDFRWYGRGVYSEKDVYDPTEELVNYSRFTNHGETSDYTVFFYLYEPGGELAASAQESGTLERAHWVEWTVTISPPEGGWPKGTWLFCSEVEPATGSSLYRRCCLDRVSAGWLVIDGEDDYAETEDHSELDVGDESGESLTIEAWVYIQRSGMLSERLYIVNKSQSYELYANRYTTDRTYGCIGFLLTAPSGQPGGFEHCHWPPYLLGWHHVAGVFYKETGEMRIYIDGEAFGNPSYFGPAINNSTEALEIGGGFKRLPGAVDELRISDVARYTGETYTPTFPFTCDEHTRALWRFDEFEGATVFHDLCGEDNLLVGYNGAHTEGVPVHRVYLPLVVKK
jgi:hypothetical protein